MKTKNKPAKSSKHSKAPVPRKVAIGKSARGEEPTAQPGPAPTPSTEPTTQPPTAASPGIAAADRASATKQSKPSKQSKPPKQPRATTPPKETKPRRASALDAAAIVLASVNKPMRAVDLIAEMQNCGLWTSPGGKTPEATLYAAMTREITTKGDLARFKKVERGLFEVRMTAGGDTDDLARTPPNQSA